jgi:drug/metabolite transporter (DMT)-like permease
MCAVRAEPAAPHRILRTPMPIVALLLVVLSAFLHAAWNAAAKQSGAPAAFVFLADLTALVVLAPVFLYFRLSDLTAELWWLVLATGAIHGVYAWALTRAYETGDLTLVYPISRSTPAFVPLLAVPFLGERLSTGGVIGIALVMAGIWLVSTNARLAVRSLFTRELRYAYLTLATTVAYSLVDKRAMELLDHGAWAGPAPRAVAYYVLLCVSYLPFFYLFSRRRLDGATLRSTLRQRPVAVLSVVVASFVSYTLILQALRTAPVSYVVATRQLSVVFAVALAMWWLRERPSGARLAGAALTVLGVAVIGLAGG